ncbi:MAG: asparaginase [Betaproteobacteria bacterium]
MGSQKIVVLGTGGTIAGTGASGSEHINYQAAQIGVADLLAGVPALASWQQRLELEQLAQIDSKDMDEATWARLAQRVAELLARADVQGVVITHGTDTLEETAYFLHAVLAPGKPVVLTCAMRPATATGADGPQNLVDAICVAATPQVSGVLSVVAGAVHGPLDVQKVHPYRLDAFSSGDAGALAYVEEGRVRQLRPWPVGQPRLHLLDHLSRPWPKVAIVISHALVQAWALEALVQQGARGLVVAATGNGTIHRSLQPALLQAEQAGVKLLRASRCALGQMLVQPSGEGQAAPGLPHSLLSPVKARIALALDLMEAS